MKALEAELNNLIADKTALKQKQWQFLLQITDWQMKFAKATFDRTIAGLVIVNVQHKFKRCGTRHFWVHSILRKCQQWGEYHRLVWELRLDGVLFEQYFRMSPDTFDELLGRVRPLITRADSVMRKAIGSAQRLAICLRYLATGDSFKTIAFSYQVGHSTVTGIVKDVASAIWAALVEDTMPVPKKEDWRAIADQFYARWNFPNCLGAIDGKHVLLQAPANLGSLFFNYKSIYSLVLLDVVNANYLFRVVDVAVKPSVNPHSFLLLCLSACLCLPDCLPHSLSHLCLQMLAALTVSLGLAVLWLWTEGCSDRRRAGALSKAKKISMMFEEHLPGCILAVGH
ncbi:hypothetical protein QQF64_023670 [Cirrhinus molitorella]|uniref:DDE Tnp4 domain-containing protein n=1 Tax=Cirrhinus molitorella TaxID=172907 RepID=A0ABR3NJI1_9TELE